MGNGAVKERLIVLVLKFIFRQVQLPILRMVSKFRCWDGRYGRFQAGKCCFCGPPEFLSLCSNAMHALSLMDRPLFESVAGQKLMLWYEPQILVVFDGHFGISEKYVSWKERGVIACIVYAHFEGELRSGLRLWQRLYEDTAVTRQKIHRAVRGWLETHDFPRELVDCFDK